MEYTVKDISIYYESIGSGLPVFMLHGWSVDHRLMKGCMEPIFQSVNGSWQRIYFDMPGMGKTKGRPWITGSDRMLEVVLEFIDGVLPNRHFAIAGESYGGFLARGILKARSSFVDGLLLLCPLAVHETQQAHAPKHQILERDELLLQGLSDDDREYFEGITVLQNKRVWDEFQKDILPGLKIADYSFLENSLAQHIPFKINADWIEKPYLQPTLLLMGRQDSAAGYKDQWQLMENYPRASFVVLDKAGHNLQIEQKILFAEHVKEWLDRVAEYADKK
jgi:pimeloyl-ACP methyl ester carboxylesterase